MAVVVEDLMDHARAGRIAFQEDSSTFRAVALISIASAMHALAIYAGADLLSRLVVTSSGSNQQMLVLGAPTNHFKAFSIKSVECLKLMRELS